MGLDPGSHNLAPQLVRYRVIDTASRKGVIIMEPTMRLFIAINFDSETRNKLVALQDELRKQAKNGSFTSPQNLHLTLQFLGDCDVNQTIAIKAAMANPIKAIKSE